MAQLLGYDPKHEGFDPQYLSPPRVHWLVLLAAWWTVESLIRLSVPDRYQALASSIVVGGWVFYICNWIGRLMPDAKSPFWCDVLVVVELGCAGLGSVYSHSLIVDVLALAAAILGIVTIFLVRSDLENHYNNREHAGLVLNGLMTFLFSFIYFQYHLYDIAQRRKLALESVSGGRFS